MSAPTYGVCECCGETGPLAADWSAQDGPSAFVCEPCDRAVWAAMLAEARTLTDATLTV